jgi:ferredoxin
MDTMVIPVKVLPVDATLSVRLGESVMAAARRQGWRWPTVCNGDGECGICYMSVEEGADLLVPLSQAERSILGLGMAANDPSARLACQAVPTSGPLVVRRKGARPPR